MRDYPAVLTAVQHTEPVPRRIRATLGGETVLDSCRALYVWEWPYYPQFAIPAGDVRSDFLRDENRTETTDLGTAQVFGLTVGDRVRAGAALRYVDSPIPALAGSFRFEWTAMDTWYEEDEQVFVHPRSPYVRVDVLRSSRTVRVELDGLLLAESDAPVMVVETGLPTRYYLPRTAVDFTHLEPSSTVTECPYKGTTTEYWSVRSGEVLHPDLAWSYRFPTRELLAVTSYVAFYNEQVDIAIDGVPQPRPATHFFDPA